MTVSIFEQTASALVKDPKDPNELKTVITELFNLLLKDQDNGDLRKSYVDVARAMPDHLRPILKEFEKQAVAVFVNHAEALPDMGQRAEAYREAVRQAPRGSELERQAKQKLKELEPTRRSEIVGPVQRCGSPAQK
jgi:hypothetical protein